MKQMSGSYRGVVRGSSSGWMISLLVHIGIGLLATTVFLAVKNHEEPVVFVPAAVRPPVELDLIKPKVNISESSKPARQLTRIAVAHDTMDRPQVELPALGRMGTDLSDGLNGGGVVMSGLPDLGDLPHFGDPRTIGNDLEGTFYDFRRDRRGRPIIMDPSQCIDVLSEFVRRGWKKSVLARYYQSPNTLYTTTIAIPPVQSALGPLAFGEPETGSYCYGILYEGELVHEDDITFRFWGLGDDVMVVAVDGEVVLNGFYPRNGNEHDTERITPHWTSNDPKAREYWLGIQRSNIGDWITLEGGKPRDLKILIGEIPGGLFQALLTVEVKGETYPRNPEDNGPTLPLFKTSELTLDMIDAIHIGTNPGDLCATNGPVFRDYNASGTNIADRAEDAPDEPAEVPAGPVDRNGLRTWTGMDGTTLEAGYVTRMGSMVVMKTAGGEQIKIPFSELSATDQKFVELANPPEFNIEFSKKSTTVAPPALSPYEGDQRPLRISNYVFGTRLKQSSTGAYDHKLTVEYYAIGKEVDGNNFILFERQKSGFVPSATRNGAHAFYGETIRVQQQALRASAVVRGSSYGGFLVTVSDESGAIIQYQTSHEFLYENMENLKKLPLTGKVHFNKECVRVVPPRLSPDDRPGI